MNTQQAYEQIREFFSRPGAVLAWSESAEQCVYREPDAYDNPDYDPDDDQNYEWPVTFVYRANSPVRCALGCLIPDELYDPVLEGRGVANILADNKPLTDYFAGVDQGFLVEAQAEHDAIASSSGLIADFLEALDQIAHDYGLQVPA
jgi:hypothetical protein